MGDLKRNRIMRLTIPVDAPFEALVDESHPMLQRHSLDGSLQERVLAAWRASEGYKWYFDRKDLDGLINALDDEYLKACIDTAENFLSAEPWLYTAGGKKRRIKLKADTKISDSPNAVAIDWHHYDPDDVEWLYHVNRQHYLPKMAVAARATGRDDIAERIFEIMDHWIANCPCPEDQIIEKKSRWGKHWKSPWQMLNCGLRIINWMDVLHLLWDHPSLTPERFARYVHSMRQQALVVGRTTPNTDRKAEGNHMLMETWGLLTWSLLPWTKESRLAREVAVHNLQRCMNAQILPDGGHGERVPGYHAACVVFFARPVLLCKLNRIKLDRRTDSRLDKMVKYLPYIIMPDRKIAHFGDSSASSNEEALALGSLITGIRLPWQPRFDARHLLISNAPPIKEKRPAWPTAAAFPHTGYVSARTSWKEDASCIVMHVCGFGGGHTHSDWLSFIYAIDGRTVITERGINTYNPDRENMMFRVGRSHNVMQIGQRDAIVHQTTMWDKYVDAHARLLGFNRHRDGRVEWAGSIRWLDGTTWIRRVRFDTDGSLCLTDTFKGPRADTIELRFHLDTTNARMLSPLECITTDEGKPNVRIKVDGNGLEGTLSPVDLSPTFSERKKGLLLCFSGRIKPPAEWKTTIRRV